MGLCNHRSRGDRTSISVWCSHVSATPAYGNQVRTHCQVTTAPEKKRKKAKKPLIGVVCLLTTGGLISVRCGLRQGHWPAVPRSPAAPASDVMAQEALTHRIHLLRPGAARSPQPGFIPLAF